MSEHVDSDPPIGPSRIIGCCRSDLHPSEFFGTRHALKSIDQRFQLGVARVHRYVNRHGRSFLGPDAVWRNRAIGAREKHAAPDQRKGPDKDAEAHLHDRIEFLFFVRHTDVAEPPFDDGHEPRGTTPKRFLEAGHSMPEDGSFECGEVLFFVVFSVAITCGVIPIAGVGQASYADDTVVRLLHLQHTHALSISTDFTNSIHLTAENLSL